jgi:PncC family amidohydrolase
MAESTESTAGRAVDPSTATPEAADPLVELAARIGERCLARGLRLATVESCTGGLVGHLITEIPGSSAYFIGGLVTYSDDLKRQLADVPEEVLAAHGAVSAQTAIAMATGGRARTGTDLAASVTGIAGPDGGSPDKPVGLTYVAVADAEGAEVRRHLWTGNRAENKRASAEAVLALILERIDNTPEPA